jgi:hypothetical protein
MRAVPARSVEEALAKLKGCEVVVAETSLAGVADLPAAAGEVPVVALVEPGTVPPGGGFRCKYDRTAPPDGLTSLLSELLFGPHRVDAVRVGPALDVRTRAFDTLEPAAGAALLLPVAHGFPLVLTAAAGYALAGAPRDGPFALATLAWAFRPYNYLSHYGFGLALYGTARAALDDGAWEAAFGVEVDLEFLVAIPFMFAWEWLTEGDPDEP